MPEFLIRVTKGESGNIISLYSPDFAPNLLEFSNHQDINNSNYRPFIIEIMTYFFTIQKKQVIPKTFEELSYILTDDLKRWESFTIDFQPQQINSGLFSKALPRIGHVTNILGVLSGGFITFMALRVASSNHHEDSSSSSNALSIFATILSSIISVIIYIYSGATEMLTGIGHGIDQSIAKACRCGYEVVPTVAENANHHYTFAKKLIFLFAMGAVSTNTLITGIRVYQESSLLADKYLGLYPGLSDAEREKYRELLRWLVVNLLVSVGAYTSLAFQGSFAIKLVEELCNKFERRETSELQDNEPPTNTNNSMFFQYPNASSSLLHLASASDLQSSPLPLLEDRQPRTTSSCSLS